MPTNKKPSTATVVWQLAAPVAERLSLILWDVKMRKEGADWHLHILLDKPGGITLDDCETFYREFDPILDEADPIEQQYILEIESPGIERDLVRDFHFEMMAGYTVLVGFFTADASGNKSYTGVLKGLIDNKIVIETETGDLSFDKKAVKKVNAVYEEA